MFEDAAAGAAAGRADEQGLLEVLAPSELWWGRFFPPVLERAWAQSGPLRIEGVPRFFFGPIAERREKRRRGGRESRS